MDSITMDDGRMTYDQFLNGCSRFLELSQANKDQWTLEGDQTAFGESYLSTTFLRKSTMPKWEEKDEVPEMSINECQILQYQFDVLYSVSHSVPVLYFMISTSSGTPLSLDEVWKTSSGSSNLSNHAEQQQEMTQSLYNVVSIQDHPVLHVPFFCVHPCNNLSILKECYESTNQPTCEQYLISWMSIVGNQFGLRLSHKYFENFVTKETPKCL